MRTYKVYYTNSYAGAFKVWKFRKLHVARDFYSKVVRSLKDTDTVFRLAGDGTKFFVKHKEYKYQFMLRRVDNEVQLAWHNPDRKDKWRDKKYVSFERIFEHAPTEVRKILAFHFDIFA